MFPIGGLAESDARSSLFQDHFVRSLKWFREPFGAASRGAPGDGPLRVANQRSPRPIASAFVEACCRVDLRGNAPSSQLWWRDASRRG
jgi:hypothetical protein